ncbi:MAG: hypothetical protein H6Q73_3412 [Firmicutes bacterium]|nr:hypothetical protein [Bacillota bacterium]
MLLHIGEKILNSQKIHRVIDDILEKRVRGMSQQDIANKLGVDRTFISRLESLGEVRKGGRVALVGFPIENCSELSQMAQVEGVDYCLVMSEKERWEFVQSKTGVELTNMIMELVGVLRMYDSVIIIGSDMRVKLATSLLDKDVIGVEIGESPLATDKYVDVNEIRNIIRQLHS